MFQTSYLLNNILFNEIAVKILSSSLSWDKPFKQVSSSSLDLNPEIEHPSPKTEKKTLKTIHSPTIDLKGFKNYKSGLPTP